MDVWNWNSPIGLVLFFIGCGVMTVLFAWAVRLLSSVTLPKSLTTPPTKKK